MAQSSVSNGVWKGSDSLTAFSCSSLINSTHPIFYSKKEFNDGHTSDVGSTACDICVEGFYMSLDGECKECDADGMSCIEGTTIRTIEISKTYYRFSEDSPKVHCA